MLPFGDSHLEEQLPVLLVECMPLSPRHTRWKLHAKVGDDKHLHFLCCVFPCSINPSFPAIFFKYAIFEAAQANTPILADTCCALPHPWSNGLHPCPSAPAGNMQPSVPAGRSNFDRKFFKPVPEVLLSTEIKALSNP